mmetsp:Transcript_4608/g.10128  ORF Transcript_4608/g.10128 Transcript_4608/m.10128 type:complete len:80 (+) Transcript_4608:294-533(+)
MARRVVLRDLRDLQQRPAMRFFLIIVPGACVLSRVSRIRIASQALRACALKAIEVFVCTHGRFTTLPAAWQGAAGMTKP